jgi:hypothetical protein
MRWLRVGFLVSLSLCVARPLRAEPNGAAASAPTFGDRFFRGTSPGELPAPKVLVVSTFYAASLASIVVGATNLVRAGNQGDDAETYKLAQTPGFCNDLSSDPCVTYRRLLDEERETRTMGLALFGAGGIALLAGALTAELWPNDKSTPKVSLFFDRSGGGFTAFAKF